MSRKGRKREGEREVGEEGRKGGKKEGRGGAREERREDILSKNYAIFNHMIRMVQILTMAGWSWGCVIFCEGSADKMKRASQRKSGKRWRHRVVVFILKAQGACPLSGKLNEERSSRSLPSWWHT